MFFHESTLERASGVVVIKDADADAVRAIVNHCHGFLTLDFDDDLLIQFVILADRYLIVDMAVSFCFVMKER